MKILLRCVVVVEKQSCNSCQHILIPLHWDHHFVITPNDYLKYEGYIEAKKVFDHLGMSVGIMPENIHERKQVKKKSLIKILFMQREASIAHSMLLIVWPSFR